MEFKSLKNIESSFRQLRLFGMIFLAACTVVTVWSVWSSYSEPSGRGEGTRPPLSRTVLYAGTRKECH